MQIHGKQSSMCYLSFLYFTWHEFSVSIEVDVSDRYVLRYALREMHNAGSSACRWLRGARRDTRRSPHRLAGDQSSAVGRSGHMSIAVRQCGSTLRARLGKIT